MASFDRKFEIIMPSDYATLYRSSVSVADLSLLDPLSTTPPALVDGELTAINSTGKLIRATDPTALSFFYFEDRGDYGVQASRKAAIIRIGGFVANTILFDAALTTVGAAVMHGDITTADGLTRRGLVAHTGSNLVIGYVTKTAANNGGRLQFQQTLV